MNERLQRLRAAFEDLNEREKKLVLLMTAIGCSLALLLPLYLLWSSVNANYDQVEAAQSLISSLQNDQEKYRELRAERERKQQLYSNPAPALGSFMEQETQRFGIALREADDQPPSSAAGYKERSIRVTLNNAPIKSVIQLLGAIEDSGHPVSIERIQLESYSLNGTYDTRLTVAAYEKEGAATNPAAAGTAESAN